MPNKVYDYLAGKPPTKKCALDQDEFERALGNSVQDVLPEAIKKVMTNPAPELEGQKQAIRAASALTPDAASMVDTGDRQQQTGNRPLGAMQEGGRKRRKSRKSKKSRKMKKSRKPKRGKKSNKRKRTRRH